MPNAYTEFAVGEEYSTELTMLYDGLQQTELWKKIGSSCFCAAGFISLAFAALGRQVRILPCYAVAIKDEAKFALGYKNLTSAPGQVDGHVVGLVDERILVDFGLRNVQRYFSPDFPAAAACEVDRWNLFPNELVLRDGLKIGWRNDWVNPATAGVMAYEKSIYETLFNQYQAVMSSRQSVIPPPSRVASRVNEN